MRRPISCRFGLDKVRKSSSKEGSSSIRKERFDVATESFGFPQPNVSFSMGFYFAGGMAHLGARQTVFSFRIIPRYHFHGPQGDHPPAHDDTDVIAAQRLAQNSR